MATDIRGLPPTGALELGRFTAKAPAPAGFTAGAAYWPLALGVDCAPTPPVVYALVAGDDGTIRAVAVSGFAWTIDSPP